MHAPDLTGSCRYGQKCTWERMKDRATIVCWRRGRVLLVARARSRWSLPGGTIRRYETPLQAVKRELEEETGLTGIEPAYLFQFGGLSKLHHVFAVKLASDVSPTPGNEISRCRWFSPLQIATLSASVPTRGIIEVVFSERCMRAAAATPDG